MKLFLVVGLLAVGCYAQSGDQSVPVAAQSMDVRVMVVPPSAPATYLNLTVDASSNGGDSIDVISSNSQLPISLVLPSGVEVTPTNASGLGFTVLQQVISPTDNPNSGGFTPFDAVGAHTTFILPGNSPAGIYQVKANSTNILTSTNVTATYISPELCT
jgi:hypothetical protein